MLQHIATHTSNEVQGACVLQCDAVLHCVAVHCSVLQCIVYCDFFSATCQLFEQCVAVLKHIATHTSNEVHGACVLQCDAVLHCVAVHCSVLQCIAVCCSALPYVAVSLEGCCLCDQSDF